jgi:DNA-binding transcriptional regulator YiaG
MRTPPEAAVTRELENIHRAYQRATRAILRARDPEVAFRAAHQLSTGMRELYDGPDGATRVVAQAALRLREARRYSLAELARVVNVSKSMAAYWDRRAREGE